MLTGGFPGFLQTFLMKCLKNIDNIEALGQDFFF